MVSFTESIELLKKSVNVLMQDKKLLVFPLISIAALSLVFILFAIPLVATALIDNTIVTILAILIFYFVMHVVGIYSTSALYYAIRKRLENQEYTFGECLSFPMKHIVNILMWAAITATVGTILNALTNNSGRGVGALIGKLVGSLIGAAWSIATFFVVPIMIFEEKNPFDAMKESLALIGKTWGAQVTRSIGFGLVSFALIMLGLGIGFVMYVLFHPTGIALLALIGIGVMYLVAISLVFGALQAVFITALYLNVAKGVSTVFDAHVQSAFK